VAAASLRSEAFHSIGWWYSCHLIRWIWKIGFAYY
jgi:hypothetical protein